MKYLKIAIKYCVYACLLLLLLFQIIAFLTSSNLKEYFFRGGILFVIGMYFAIKWQKKNRKIEEITKEDKNS
jgi:hypothetical protein